VNIHISPNSIAYEIVYDEKKGIASGVRVINAETKEKKFKASIIFSCALTIGTASILMQSKSERFPNGLGNYGGELGYNIMGHTSKSGVYADVEGFQNFLES